MSLNLMSGDGLTARGMAFHGMVFHFAIVTPLVKAGIPLDPPDIVSKNDEGFSVDTNNMERLRPYMMTFKDSKYVIWKDENDALVIKEV